MQGSVGAGCCLVEVGNAAVSAGVLGFAQGHVGLAEQLSTVQALGGRGQTDAYVDFHFRRAGA